MFLQKLLPYIRLYLYWYAIFPAIQEYNEVLKFPKAPSKAYRVYCKIYRRISTCGIFFITTLYAINFYVTTKFQITKIIASSKIIINGCDALLSIFVCGSCVVSTPKFEHSRLIHHMIRIDRTLIGNHSVFSIETVLYFISQFIKLQF